MQFQSAQNESDEELLSIFKIGSKSSNKSTRNLSDLNDSIIIQAKPRSIRIDTLTNEDDLHFKSNKKGFDSSSEENEDRSKTKYKDGAYEVIKIVLTISNLLLSVCLDINIYNYVFILHDLQFREEMRHPI